MAEIKERTEGKRHPSFLPNLLDERCNWISIGYTLILIHSWVEWFPRDPFPFPFPSLSSLFSLNASSKPISSCRFFPLSFPLSFPLLLSFFLSLLLSFDLDRVVGDLQYTIIYDIPTSWFPTLAVKVATLASLPRSTRSSNSNSNKNGNSQSSHYISTLLRSIGQIGRIKTKRQKYLEMHVILFSTGDGVDISSPGSIVRRDWIWSTAEKGNKVQPDTRSLISGLFPNSMSTIFCFFFPRLRWRSHSRRDSVSELTIRSDVGSETRHGWLTNLISHQQTPFAFYSRRRAKRLTSLTTSSSKYLYQSV